MPDILCPLLHVPDPRPLREQLAAEGIIVRRARAWERARLCEFIATHFSQGWVDETLMAFGRHPITTFIALDGGRVVGFAAYEVTAPTYFGPTGVDEAYRGRNIGKALLYEALHGLRELGYVYGVIGSPGPVDFYLKATPGVVLPADWSNIYSGAL